MSRSGESSIDFSIVVSDTEPEDLDTTKDAEALTILAAGIIADLKDRSMDLFKIGQKVMDAAREINMAEGK